MADVELAVVLKFGFSSLPFHIFPVASHRYLDEVFVLRPFPIQMPRSSSFDDWKVPQAQLGSGVGMRKVTLPKM